MDSILPQEGELLDLVLPARAAKAGKPEQLGLLEDILDKRQLEAHFQPILDLKSGEIIGYEGLIRGPVETPLHAPVELFRVAGKHGYALRLERLCRQTVLESFARLGLPHKLFLNVRPQCLALPGLGTTATRELLRRLGLSPERIVIELTENLPFFDFNSVRAALTNYRNLGFNVAIDDLGEGFASFRLWSELRPEYVKADMHFVQGIDSDPLKLQFLKSIQQIADTCRSHIIAEGVETEAELAVVRDLGIPFGQGYLVGRPVACPVQAPPDNVLLILRQREIAVYPETVVLYNNAITAEKLLIPVAPVRPEVPNDEVFARFERDASLHAIPVVESGAPVGLLTRFAFVEAYARPFRKELFGRKPCRGFMDPNPLVVDKDITIQELSNRLVDADRRFLAEGFVLTERGRYVGPRHRPGSGARDHQLADSGRALRQPSDTPSGQRADQRAHRAALARAHRLHRLPLRPGSLQAVQRRLWLSPRRRHDPADRPCSLRRLRRAPRFPGAQWRGRLHHADAKRGLVDALP
jgi:EAL domain-containing protein (putative c-di-GMP-specific phosphodiesterase class I)/CBS domain-containing protein